MNFKVNKSNIKVSGSCLQGHITATYDELVKAFGEPEEGCDKVKAEWNIKFADGTIATIYDWKNYHLETAESVTDWHVGGFTGLSVVLVDEVLINSK
jgi:hypothetical protein